jgi:hypothetical protein
MLRVYCVLALFVHVARAEPNRERVASMVGAIYEGEGMRQLTELSDTVGARLTGSPAYMKSADWAAAQLRAAGAQSVHLEKFTMAHGWQRGVERARFGARDVHVAQVGWTASTPRGGVRAPVVVIHDIESATVSGPSVKGKIVLLDRTESGKGLKSVLALRGASAALKQAGAVALLLPMRANAPNGVIGASSLFGGGEVAALPIGLVGFEDAAAIERAPAGKTTLDLELSATISGRVDVPNVIGELPGDKTSKEWILVGAHLDSWDLATGTQDNGAGVVQVLQAARALAAAGPLTRTVRFALWGGEEEWLSGSHAYAEAHQDVLASCVAVLNTDHGAGHVKGWNVEGRKDVKAALQLLAKDMLAPLGGAATDLEINPDTDHFPFVAAGVPALDLVVDTTEYFVVHHRVGDTIDKVDAHALASGAAVVAVTAYALASSRDAFAPHLDRAAVTELLKPQGLDDTLRSLGWWKP